MPFFVSGQHSIKPSNHFKAHIIVTGIFVALSYMFSLLPLALFAIAQTLAIFGKKTAFLLSLGVVCCLCFLTITGFSPFLIGALFAIISLPFFLLVSVLRQKNTSVFWSALVLGIPIVLFFSSIIFMPSLNKEQYTFEIQKIENTITNSQLELQNKTYDSPHQESYRPNVRHNQEAHYEKVSEQLEIIKKDQNLQNFVGWNSNQRIVYFVYGDGFSVFLTVLLSFAACLFFLDFAFEKVEKLQGIAKYVNNSSRGVFDKSLLIFLQELMIKIPKYNNHEKSNKNQNLDFQVIKHSKLNIDGLPEKRLLGLFLNHKNENTITFRDYIFYYVGQLPGWNLKNYQMPLILCILSIMVLASTVFYFGSIQNIIQAAQIENILFTLVVFLSVLAVGVLSVLVLQGIFATLKWVSFGFLVFISVVFFVVSPYIMVDIGAYAFLGVFGIIGLLGYLK